MKKSFNTLRQTTIDIYLYSEQYEKREVLRNTETATIANLRYMPVLDFDLKSLAGKEIVSGTLTVKMVTPDYPLEVDITTISQDWDETCANYYTSKAGTGWAGDKWLSDVMMSQGNSMYFREATCYDESSGILKVNIPVEVLYTMANGQSFGFGMIDCKSRGYGSKEGEGWNVLKKFNVSESNGPAPVLEVEYAEVFKECPENVKALSAQALENPESTGNASAVLKWSIEEETAEYRYYNIYISEQESNITKMEKLPRYLVPVYKAGEAFCGTEIDNLRPNTRYFLAVTVSNGQNESEPVYAELTTLGLRSLPDTSGAEAAGLTFDKAPLLTGNGFKVYVLDEISKVDPVRGVIYTDQKKEEGKALSFVGDYRGGLFNGEKVELLASPGEKMAFQLLVESESGCPCTFKAEVNGVANGLGVEAGRVWYLKKEENWYPEVVVPMAEGGSFELPYNENGIDGQKYQALEIDLELSPVMQEGDYSFNVSVAAGPEQVTVPVEVKVVPVKLERSKFILELNGYVCLSECAGINRSDPDYWKVEEEYYRVAHKHHMSINILPYSHFGTVQEAFSPKIEFVDGLPRVTDWTEWDEHFEKYLDGSYLLETEGTRVPVTHIYLPFHENWPMPINDYYGVKVERGPEAYPENINEHKLKANSPYVDFMPQYREGIKAVMKDFILHTDEKGWKDVQFQYFFNNKHFYKQKGFVDRCRNRKGLEMWLTEQTCGNDGQGTSWWLLDEPHFRDDWEAIHYYGSILREAQKELNSGYNLKFRVDISCYNQLFDFLDGVLDTSIVAGRPYNDREDLTRKRKQKYGEDYWVYGSWNPVDQPNMNSFLWILEAYLKGGSGLVPWYNFALDVNYEVPDNCAGLYPGTRFGSQKPMVSLRLKSGRKALEIMRYLDAFKKAFGYSDTQLKAYVSAFLKLKGQAVVRHRDDAGLVRYEGGNEYSAIEAMKKDIISKLVIVKAK